MKFVSVTDSSNNLLPYTRYILDGAAFFNGEQEAVEQIKLLLAHEYQRWAELGAASYFPSSIAKTILDASAKRSTSVHVTGLVGLSILALKANGQTPSLERAFRLTANFCEPRHRSDFFFWDFEKLDFRTAPQNIATSVDAVRRAFRQHKSAVHICAARLSANDYLSPSAPFEPAPEADQCYLATVAAFQVLFSKYDQVDRDNRSRPLELLHIGWSPDFKIEGELLYPTDELMRQLLGSGVLGD